MRKVTVLFLSLIITGFLILPVSAQENEEKKELYMYHVVEDYVYPSMVAEYEKAVKEYTAFFKSADFKYPMLMYVTDDYHYYFMTYLENEDDLSKFNVSMDKAAEENEEKWDKIWEKFEGTYSRNKSKLLYEISELGYLPDKYDVDQSSEHYIDLSFMYIKVGKASLFKSLLKQYVEFYKKNKINLNVTSYYGGFGTEQPMFLVTQTGKDRLDFWTKYTKAMKKLNENEDFTKLLDNMLKIMRDVEYNSGHFRPDLSYIPNK